jgi:hypothetical protein
MTVGEGFVGYTSKPLATIHKTNSTYNERRLVASAVAANSVLHPSGSPEMLQMWAPIPQSPKFLRSANTHYLVISANKSTHDHAGRDLQVCTHAVRLVWPVAELSASSWSICSCLALFGSNKHTHTKVCKTYIRVSAPTSIRSSLSVVSSSSIVMESGFPLPSSQLHTIEEPPDLISHFSPPITASIINSKTAPNNLPHMIQRTIIV